MANTRKRYAIVGLGGRHEMFRDAILETFKATSELVALCDSNEGRLRYSQQKAQEKCGGETPGYDASDFDKMIQEKKPGTIVVTTKDCAHDEYICRAMELGCDVITEKPMTTDEAKCRRILETKQKTGRDVKVTFNYRYAPPRTQAKELLMSGVIGDILSVDFHWMLDVHHGADYFRRWHRHKENSGGLLVHKATHHFDLVNWWLGTVPETVTATGHRRFYTPETADRYGLRDRGDRCHGCSEAARCRFFLDMETTGSIKPLYLDSEQYDGYFRDRCVFGADIDIEDCMNVVVDYANGIKMSYSLNAFMPWEGYVIAFNGTRGRLEHDCRETSYVSGDGSVQGTLKKEGTWIRIYPHWKQAYEVKLKEAEGGHGGADPLMLQYIFDPDNQPEDPCLRAADERSGAWSILTGVAANHSMREGRPIRVDELVPDIGMPDYPPMPSSQEPLQMPEAET